MITNVDIFTTTLFTNYNPQRRTESSIAEDNPIEMGETLNNAVELFSTDDFGSTAKS
ncbi:hypothetical protein AB1303_08375 [Saccharolobus solfataricus]|uniref:hypothetical protein n=1 Tax=Saccharolobus solfataricus TaxID=2287 RepID=UPI000A4185B5|nr:hypothetical protein [Saccharolobus solfataricus]